MRTTNTWGGGIDQTAIIGHAPESRDWYPTHPIYLPVVHPEARVEAYVTVDSGERRSTRVGARSWLMKHVHIGHDAWIGEDCELAPGVVICGFVVIGNGVKIGVNACVLPYCTIGDGVRIGAGAVVTKDFSEGVLVGNPARPMGKET